MNLEHRCLVLHFLRLRLFFIIFFRLRNFGIERYCERLVILGKIIAEGLIDAPSHIGYSLVAIEELLFGGGRDKSQFDEAAGHRRLPEHEESRLLHPLVGSCRRSACALLHHLGQFDTLCHILVLKELEHDIALRRTRVESLVVLLVVFFYQNHRVFSLCHIKVVGRPVHTKGICFQSHSLCSLGQGIGVDGDKEVGLVAVGDIGTLVERDENIGLTSVYYVNAGTIVFHETSEGESNVEIDILLLGKSAKSSGVMPSMSSVDDEREALLGSQGHSEREYQHYRSYNPSFHIHYYI